MWPNMMSGGARDGLLSYSTNMLHHDAMTCCHTPWTCSITTQWLAVILHDDTDSVEAPRLDILLFHCLERFAAAIKRVIYQPLLFTLQYVLLLCHNDLQCRFAVSRNISWQCSVTLKVTTLLLCVRKHNLKMAMRRLMSMMVVMRA